jgi:hypothetical protein
LPAAVELARRLSVDCEIDFSVQGPRGNEFGAVAIKLIAGLFARNRRSKTANLVGSVPPIVLRVIHKLLDPTGEQVSHEGPPLGVGMRRVGEKIRYLEIILLQVGIPALATRFQRKVIFRRHGWLPDAGHELLPALLLEPEMPRTALGRRPLKMKASVTHRFKRIHDVVGLNDDVGCRF